MTYGKWAASSPYSRIDTLIAPSIAPAALVPALLAGSLLLVGVVLASILLKSDSMQGIGQLARERMRRTFSTSNGNLLNGNLAASVLAIGKGKGWAVDDDVDEDIQGATYPGLVNTSTTCYLNSTLQSLASCPSFVAYLTSLIQSSEMHLELVNSLLLMLEALNKPSKYSRTLRTTEILDSLMNSTSSSNASRNRRRIMQGSGQQDAQEFFLILAETVEEEKKVLFQKLNEKREENVGFRELPLPLELLDSLTRIGRDDTLKNPFEALMAHRTVCVTCGYAEAIRHTPTENLSLNVPSARVCLLEELLGEYTKLETIPEFGCRRCTILGTRNRLQDQLTSQKMSEGKMTVSRKKRIRELQRTLSRLEEIIDLGDFEADIAEFSIKLDRAIGPARKQVMFCAPPKLLVLHLSRSSFYEGSYGYSQKNNCRVQFPEYLDMDHFTTSSNLNMDPSKPLSTPKEKIATDVSKVQSAYRDAEDKRPTAQQLLDGAIQDSKPVFGYALCAVVVHIGSHSSGHYLTFRRRPRHGSKGLSQDWFRISDEDVETANIQDALSSNPFLLFYERTDASSSNVQV